MHCRDTKGLTEEMDVQWTLNRLRGKDFASPLALLCGERAPRETSGCVSFALKPYDTADNPVCYERVPLCHDCAIDTVA